MNQAARYDGHADWYEDWNRPHAEQHAHEVQELFGPGQGLCLDLGCGSGHYFGTLQDTGRTRVGMRQYPLAQLLTAFVRTGLVIEYVAEHGDRAVPTILAIRARKPA